MSGRTSNSLKSPGGSKKGKKLNVSVKVDSKEEKSSTPPRTKLQPQSPIASATKGRVKRKAPRRGLARNLTADPTFSKGNDKVETIAEEGEGGGEKKKILFSPKYNADPDHKEEPPSESDEDEEDPNYIQAFDPYRFIKSLPASPPTLSTRQAALPRRTRQVPPVTLVLDLDETLVHCSTFQIPNYELKFVVGFNGMDHQVYVRRRPHLLEFLRSVSAWFEVVIFTASQKVYADKLLNIIDPGRKYIRHRLFRDSCVVIDGNYIKDLTILGRPLETCAIIDNSPQAFGFQLDNGIPIESWFDDDKDTELLKMLPFLEKLKDIKDVRPHIRSKFRLRDYVDSLQ